MRLLFGLARKYLGQRMKVIEQIKYIGIAFIVVLAAKSLNAEAKSIPVDRILNIDEIPLFLKDGVLTKEFQNALQDQQQLATYLRDVFSKRYFFDARELESRFSQYNQLYPAQKKLHYARTRAHMDLHPANTGWKLPFNTLEGKPVTAYQFRHLSRQHKMVDIAFTHFYKQSDDSHIRYFVDQVKSLNHAFTNKSYETVKDGNGVYEKFRAGYRVLNWLLVHNFFMNEESYSDKDQLTTIATLLHEGASLHQKNKSFQSGNHQTRGVSVLAMLAIIFEDFEGTDEWFKTAIKLLEMHLDREINADGFQFERSVHYHISDIWNYFYVYQLAKLNNVEISQGWQNKLRELFVTLVKISFPNKTAPVLQDDTDAPWSEFNDISSIMTLGYLLFEEPEFGYFSTGSISPHMYWYVRSEQLKQIENIESQTPDYGSLAFPDTGYYIMREGWQPDDKMMIVSAGVDKKKPDHQHGDVLGVQAYANGHIVLPNYQVRYNLQDYGWFKNSRVKSVALVDNVVQGQQYTSNKGGSGFGKFKKLPHPTVLAWDSNKNIDVFIGSHDGFVDIGVQYSRQAVYVRHDFWLLKDNFVANGKHEYQQVWQGHYTHENAPNLLRATFANGSGFDILQLDSVDGFSSNGKRGKQWSIITKKEKGNSSFITILFPYSSYLNRINETAAIPKIDDWIINSGTIRMTADDALSLSKGNRAIILQASTVDVFSTTFKFSRKCDFFLTHQKDSIELQSISDKEVIVQFEQPKTFIKDNVKLTAKEIRIQPAEKIALITESPAASVSVIP